jgi:hypothetical protein
VDINFKISAKHLHLIAAFASTDETRFVICGVLIELRPGSPPMLVATDGRCLASLRTDEIHNAETPTFIVIPSSFTQHMQVYYDAMLEHEHLGFDVYFAFDSQTNLIEATVAEITFKFKAVEGNFPNWRQILPDIPTPCAMELDRTVFNPKLLMQCSLWIQNYKKNNCIDIFGAKHCPLVFKTDVAMTVLMPGNLSHAAPTLAPFDLPSSNQPN